MDLTLISITNRQRVCGFADSKQRKRLPRLLQQRTSHSMLEMATVGTETLKPPEDQFAVQLDKLLASNQWQDALALFEDAENRTKIVDNCPDLIPTVVKYLTDRNLAQNFELHNAAENILIQISTKCKEDDVVIGLLEVIDSTKTDNTVVSVLKALQALLLKQTDDTTKAIEWVLNTVQQYASELPLSSHIRNRLDNEEEEFLEEEDEVKRIVSFYIFMEKFYEPILMRIIQIEPENRSHFRNNGQSSRNILACFIIQLFGVPFAYLDLSDPTSNMDRCSKGVTLTNVYTRQCVTALVQHLNKLIVNPLQLIAYGHRRALWPYVFPESDDPIMYSDMPSDIFLLDAKVSMSGLAVLFYALFVENLFHANKPQIYRAVYLFEMGLYFVTDLLSQAEEALSTKGIRLAAKLLENLRDEQLDDDTLDLDIHKIFTKKLVEILDSTQVRRNSQSGVELLQTYLGKFKSINAKYFHIQHLLESTTNNKIRSILITIYKNVIAEQMNAVDGRNAPPQSNMSVFCCGDKLKWLLLNRICIMPKGVETDILQHNDLIMAALNMLRFLTLRDKKNVTQLWDYMHEIEERFLKTLRTSLDCTRAHYRLEEKRIQEKKTADSIDCDVKLPGDEYLNMSEENKLRILAIGHNTFDLIDNVLGHLNECIEAYRAQKKASNEL